jgi:P27 family predicted phage terminase small subunit
MPRGRPPSPAKPPPLRLVALEPALKPPPYLSDQMKRWWQIVLDDYVLHEHHLRLLESACGAWDRMTQAREAIRKHGLTFEDERRMLRVRPEVSVERDSRIAFARIVRELQLDPIAPPEMSGRPPVLRNNRR